MNTNKQFPPENLFIQLGSGDVQIYKVTETDELRIKYKEKWITLRSLLDLKEVRTRLRELLEEDPDIKRAYRDNISMAIYDRLEPTPAHIAESRRNFGLDPIRSFNHRVKQHRDDLADTILNIFICE